MSDRSGVGAPTHDGADPDLSGLDDASEGASTRSSENGSGTTEPAESRPRRRLGRDLFASVLGAEPAAGTPPGVPASSTSSVTPAVARDTATPDEVDDLAPDLAPDVAPARRRQLVTRDTPPIDDGDTVVDDAPLVIDSSMDPGVVPAAAETPQRRSRRGGLRARRVHRIIRRVDPWSVLKLSLLFYFCVWAMVVVSGVLIWGVAVSSGTVENIEGFIERLLSFEEFTFNADQIFRLFAMGGLIMVFLATAITAILAVLFNLISDLIGGIRITVIEEESTRRIVSSD
jgi:Transmembrane domain of unknown function (DUF3566)